MRYGAFLVAICALAVPGIARAQVTFGRDAIEELQSISIRTDVQGGIDNGQLAGLVTEVLRQELNRADILWERADPRADDCCVLRADVRMASGSGRSRFGIGYTVRLELGFRDRFGNVPTWTVIWAGRMLSNIVERNELETQVRASARELAGDFVDLYREFFPRR